MFTTAPRQELQDLLEAICPNTYFQPLPDMVLEYPAIVYRRAPGNTQFANNKPYSFTQQYELTLIARNPDEVIFAALRQTPRTTHDVFFVADNLNHDVFTTYF